MTEKSRVIQIAGSNSVQTVNIGLTTQDAQRVVDSRIACVMGELYTIASQEAISRIDKLSEGLISWLAKTNRLGLLSDPSYWKAVDQGIREAASADNDRDIDMLVDLLVERTSDMENRRRRTTIQGAMAAITSLDQETLDGLTALYIVTSYTFNYRGPKVFFRRLGRLLERCLPHGLPPDSSWTEHAVSIGAATPVPVLIPLIEYMLQRYSHWISPGVLYEGADYKRGWELMEELPAPDILTKRATV